MRACLFLRMRDALLRCVGDTHVSLLQRSRCSYDTTDCWLYSNKVLVDSLLVVNQSSYFIFLLGLYRTYVIKKVKINGNDMALGVGISSKGDNPLLLEDFGC